MQTEEIKLGFPFDQLGTILIIIGVCFVLGKSIYDMGKPYHFKTTHAWCYEGQGKFTYYDRIFLITNRLVYYEKGLHYRELPCIAPHLFEKSS